MISQPLISVIIPNYNHQRFLDQRIQTVIHQTYQNIEIIVLDDASTDKSVEIIKKYSKDKRVSYYVNKINSGSPYAQWIKGIEKAHGNYIWIAESDDFSDLSFLEKVIEIHLSKPYLALVFCKSMVVDANGVQIGSFQRALQDWTHWEECYVSDGNVELTNYFSKYNFIANASSVIFRKDVFMKQVLPYKEQIISKKLVGDKLIWTYLIRNNKIGYISEPLNFFRTHPLNVRKTTNEIANLKDNFEWASVLNELIKLPKKQKKIVRIRLYGWFHNIYNDKLLSIVADRHRIGESARKFDRGYKIHLMYWWLRFRTSSLIKHL